VSKKPTNSHISLIHNKRPEVAICRAASYSIPLLKQKIDTILNALSFTVPPGSKILLKPNLVTGDGPDGLACTDGRFIAAAAEWFLDNGALVAIGDSPAFGSSKEVMKSNKITNALKGLPVKLVDFKKKHPINLDSVGKTTIAAEIFEYDQLINLPKLKAHSQMGLSLAVKNLFGSVLGCRKALAHMRYGNRQNLFTAMIVELIANLPSGISIIDGIIAMHKEGPISGKPHQCGIIAGSRDPVALDRAVMELLNVAPEICPLWQECQRRELPGADIGQINFPLLRPPEAAVKDFIMPTTLKPIRFSCRSFLSNGAIKIINLCKKKTNAGM